MDFRMSLICAVRKLKGIVAFPSTSPPRSTYDTPLVKIVTCFTGSELGAGVWAKRAEDTGRTAARVRRCSWILIGLSFADMGFVRF